MAEYMVIGSDNCPWCDKVLRLLENYGKSVSYFSISDYPQFKVMLKKLGLATVPQVFKEDDLIGGYEDTKAYLERKQ